MTTPHAWTFLLLGAAMRALPAMFPEWFSPATGVDTSELWLRFMAWVNGGIGAGHILARQVWPAVVAVLAWRPELLAEETAEPELAEERTDRATA